MKRSAIIVFISSSFLAWSCAGGTQPGQRGTYRIAVIKYQHETCTFCPGGDTRIDDWTRLRDALKDEEVLESGSYIKGFVNTARRYGDMEPVGITSPYGVYGGSSRSWNTRESFDHFMGLILEDLQSRMPLHGVYLALHGAMAVRDIPRPEAEIARQIRELLGEDIPIVATFDLHGNEDEEFLRWAEGAFATKRYPHYDSYLQGERAAHFLRQVLRGEYIPATASRKPPVITATVLQWTGKSPCMDIMERARRWEARIPGACVSVFFGFPWSDVPDAGAAVHVMTNDDRKLADSIADDMAGYIWRVRKDFASGDFPQPEEAVRMAFRAINSGEGPVVLADYSDRPGDATWILEEILGQGLNNVAVAGLRDEKVLNVLAKQGAKSGDPFSMNVGGFTGPQAGKPVPIEGTILHFGSFWGYDAAAVIEFGENNHLFITPVYEQVISPERLRAASVDPDQYKVFVVKSRVHFRRGFDETGYAGRIIIVDAPGNWFGTTRLDALDYKYAPIDSLYPFNKNMQ
jgi:microcystin degradation protein MlrC